MIKKSRSLVFSPVVMILLAEMLLGVFIENATGQNAAQSNKSPKPRYSQSKVEYIDNGVIRLGVSLDLGGSITYVGQSKEGKNLVNNFDWGRQIQMSFFAGPIPYSEKGQTPKKHWEHIGWNPIQAGDDFGNGSKILEFRKNKTGLYVKCIPMQWPLDNVPGECTYESWIELKGNAIKVRARLNNARSDRASYQGRHQELPAVYTTGEYYRLVTYRGDKPFTGDEIKQIPKKAGKGFPWNYWLATENWAALVNDNNWGLGIYKPDSCLFIGGFAGREGKGGTHDVSTGYMAPLHTEILDHNIVYDYQYTLILGSLKEIRSYAVKQGRGRGLPNWRFEKDRQHWQYQAAGRKGTDAGWPIRGFVQLDLSKPGITAFSPPTIWKAQDAPTVHIEAAFKTSQPRAIIAWTKFQANQFKASLNINNQVEFDVQGDGEFRTYSIPLDSVPNYRGVMSYLIFRPTLKPEKGAWVKVKRIWLDDRTSNQAGFNRR